MLYFNITTTIILNIFLESNLNHHVQLYLYFKNCRKNPKNMRKMKKVLQQYTRCILLKAKYNYTLKALSLHSFISLIILVCNHDWKKKCLSVFSTQYMEMTSHQIKTLSLTLLISIRSLLLKPIAGQTIPFLSSDIWKISEVQILMTQSER